MHKPILFLLAVLLALSCAHAPEKVRRRCVETKIQQFGNVCSAFQNGYYGAASCRPDFYEVCTEYQCALRYQGSWVVIPCDYYEVCQEKDCYPVLYPQPPR